VDWKNLDLVEKDILAGAARSNSIIAVGQGGRIGPQQTLPRILDKKAHPVFRPLAETHSQRPNQFALQVLQQTKHVGAHL
jgi:hypothetical protein